jgi:septal ring-binding cell division protein DamX
MRDSVATTEDLSRRLASLKAQVDVLDASITRLYDKLMDVHVRIDTLPGSGISAAAIEAKKAGVPDQEARPGAQGTAEAAAVLGTAVIADAPGHPPADEQAAAPAAGTAAAVAEDKTEDKQLVSARAANAGTRPDANIEKPAPAAQKPTDTANRQKAPADAGASTTTQGGPWVINLVSLADKPAADRFAARAEAKDIHVQQSQVTVKGKSYWRVQAGGFATADEAKAHADSIKTKLGLKDTWISRR